MGVADEPYQRYCPGEEHIHISDAVCLGRRRANFEKCPGCQFNDDERGERPFVASLVGARSRRGPVIDEREEQMIDRVFKAYDVRATVPDLLNEETAWRIGNATAQFLRTVLTGYDRSDVEMSKLIVGRDTRTHSPMLCDAFIEGASATGTPVVDIGLIDTSQIYFAVNHLKCCGGVVTTASHNPPNYNGFKICGPKGKPIGQDTGLQEIQRIAKAIARHKVDPLDSVQRRDLAEPYRDFLRGFLRPPRPLRIVVDASNGSAGRWFPIVFADIPGLTVHALNMEHDGEFAHPPNPLVEANLAQMKAAVRGMDADFGACFDGDADRCVLVDENAETVPCDLLTALLAEEYLRDAPGAAVVYDLRSSRIVKERIEACGGVAVRERVGHVFMKRAMAERGGVVGGELSGHFYFRDFFNCDSGMLALIAVCNILTRAGRGPGLSGLIRPLRVYRQSGERNFRNDDKDAALRLLAERFADAQIDHLDGITAQYDDWWFNVRPSNTESLLRLNLEAAGPGLLAARLAELTPLLGEPVEH